MLSPSMFDYPPQKLQCSYFYDPKLCKKEKYLPENRIDNMILLPFHFETLY